LKSRWLMAGDVYDNYEDLAHHEREGRDFRRLAVDRKSPVAIIATRWPAETIVFLGFGFHQMNLKLLQPDAGTQTNAKQVFATTFGESASNAKVTEQNLRTLLRKAVPVVTLSAFCADLFDHYSQSSS